ncbi:MAG TPA: DUF4129 domain-containing protein [Candidatus Limnocylindrales bacterium]
MRSNWWADVVEPAFVGLTEGIWVAVLYLLFEVVGGTPVALGPLPFVIVTALAALVSPRLDRFGSARWQIVSLGAILVGVVGTLLGPGALSALASGGPSAAFSIHPGGWLLGLAVFRGMVAAGSLDDPDGASRPFVRGVLVLTAIWLYSGVLPAATLAAFRDSATGPTLVFATVGTAAIGLRRVHAISAPAGIEWWRNRAWLMTLTVLVTALALVAIVLADQLVTAVPAVLNLAGFAELALFVLIIAGVAGGRRGPRRSRRSSWRGYLVLAGFLILGAIIYHFLHPDTGLPPGAAGPPRSVGATGSNGALGVVIVVAVLVAIALFAILLAQSRRQPTPSPEQSPAPDDSDFQVEGPGLGWLRRARARLFGERTPRRPGSAEAAYVATLGLLEPLPGLRRLPQETPQAHARRVREAGSGTLELDLLAADYELSRWGARTLPGRETQRAISRWDRSRGWIATRIQAEEAARQHAEERAGKDREEA